MQKVASFLLKSAGAMLLALAAALFLINLASPTDWVQPLDPLLNIPLNELFWIIGGLASIVAFVCIFSERPRLTTFFVAWLACNFWVYRIMLSANGFHGLSGFLASFTDEFGISEKVAEIMSEFLLVYLLGASGVAVWALKGMLPPDEFEIMSCPACGLRIQFTIERLGQTMSCPQCKIAIKLRRPENLKMSCFFCQGHIAFPAHALGEKIRCPHCKMDITLKEPA